MTDTTMSTSPACWFQLSRSRSPPTCWSCGAMRAAHYCQECGKVQPPLPVDYFTFFGLPYKLNLDTAQLERDFYALSRKLHPDINARANDRRAGVEPRKDFAAQRRLSHAERPDLAHRVPAPPAGRATGRAVQGRDRRGAQDRSRQEAGCAADLLEEVFELNMQLEELRAEQEDGRGRSRPREGLTAAPPAARSQAGRHAERLSTAWN